MIVTFSFTTRLKTIAIFSIFLICTALILLGFELGRRAAISSFQKEQKTTNAKPVSMDTINNPNTESKR